ncbi:MAG TPA: cytochrome c [Roseiflexaceae bacterium]|nr:cytochrome c [Roseiflexaceae bacterium]
MYQRIVLASALLLLALAIAACGPQSQGEAAPADHQAIVADTSWSSRGDAGNGQLVYAERCAACHATGSEQLVGPGLAGLFSAEGPKLPAAAAYGGLLPNKQQRTETNVAAWIRAGGAGTIGVMPPQELDDQQLADLIAYLRGL